ncbi:MAG: hypothetical protein ACD_69C00314G0002 [uncultured bacterium]|nr:MAG: hypothetical protein ACD_69C00314G0002 [uncultured bacterium]OGT09537.1 MAG: hypothetical protein A2V89_02225 [Gammaproteobacteria bacterium RBG_16_37_9]HBC71485.1 hypothetical protein [Coxiellaceae bacterium]HBS51585.1 hypothetical protein [Coxiellaceae bacterium]HBY55759.1 hypothetical protein [Coxiellaceae bacterium]
MFNLRNLMVFVAVFGLSLVSGVFADEPTKPEAAAPMTQPAAAEVVKEAKEMKEEKAAMEKKEVKKHKKAKKGCGCKNKDCGCKKAVAEKAESEVKDTSATETDAYKK